MKIKSLKLGGSKMKIIEIKDLTKKYGDFVALDSIDLSIEEGEIYGILGPNGAGKSTLIGVIASLLKLNSGKVLVLGEDVSKNKVEYKKQIGLVPQVIAIYGDYTAYENIKFFAELYGLRGNKLKESIEEALNFTGLSEFKKKKAKEFSGGMQRRLNIACAIVHKPKLLIMDEPTVGVDPQSRNHILNSVKELNKRGTTIIYTSHYMEEIEYICTRIAIIDKGKVLALGTKEELNDIVSDKRTLSIGVEDPYKIDIEKVKEVEGVTLVEIDENNIVVTSSKEVNNLDKIIKVVSEKGIKINNIDFKEVTLETVFLSLTGKKLRD